MTQKGKRVLQPSLRKYTAAPDLEVVMPARTWHVLLETISIYIAPK